MERNLVNLPGAIIHLLSPAGAPILAYSGGTPPPIPVAGGAPPPQPEAASNAPPTKVSQAILFPPQSDMPEIIMDVASMEPVEGSLTHHPANSAGLGQPSSPMTRELSCSAAHLDSIVASVHPSPRNSMQDGPVH